MIQQKCMSRTLVCGLLLAAMTLGGCSASYAPSAPQEESRNYDLTVSDSYGMYDDYTATDELWMAKSEVSSNSSYRYDENGGNPEDVTFTGGETVSGALPEAQTDRKVILTANIQMETEDFAATSAQLRVFVTDAGGFVENSSAYVYTSDYYNNSRRDYRRGDFTFRVPSNTYETVKAQIEATGHVLSASDSSVDATTEFFDTESRIKTLRAQETSLLAMIEKATEVKDLIQLEQRLSEIRTDIELFQSRMNTIDRQASFSTIIVNLTEVTTVEPIVIKPTSTWEQMQGSFTRSINGILAFFEGLVIFLAAAIVPLLLIALLVFIAIRLVRRAIRKHKQKQAAKHTGDTDANENNTKEEGAK